MNFNVRTERMDYEWNSEWSHLRNIHHATKSLSYGRYCK
jgi:hypothetical protein